MKIFEIVFKVLLMVILVVYVYVYAIYNRYNYGNGYDNTPIRTDKITGKITTVSKDDNGYRWGD